MHQFRRLGSAAMALLVLSASHVAAAPKTPQAAAAAAQASPGLIAALSKEIGATPEQAAGAAGALFSVARARLTPGEFSQVSAAVPGMDALLKAAPPAITGSAPIVTTGLTGRAASAGGTLGAAAMGFSQLGLKPDAIGKAVAVLTAFVNQSGGAGVGSLLAGALK